jgi:hypothetical protein
MKMKIKELSLCYAMKTHGGVDVEIHMFSSHRHSLEMVGFTLWSISPSPMERTLPPVLIISEVEWGPELVWTTSGRENS